MIRVGILGATGYTAIELIELLLRHPQVEITRLTSRDPSPRAVADVHPRLRNRLELEVAPLDLEDFCDAVDFVFSCLPHAASAEIVSQMKQANLKIVDFSADYRLSSADLFEQVYQTDHPDRDQVGNVPYGIPELFGDEIRQASLVANPGCFPTSALIPLCPLLKNGLIESTNIIVDSKTGVSGAGRKPKLSFHFPECNESVSAYGIGTHRHRPEMEDLLNRFSGVQPEVVFSPHLIPMTRGILSTIYVTPVAKVTCDEVRSCWRQQFGNSPFVRMAVRLPATADVAGTNFCDLFVETSGNRMVIISVLDNLIKGASGAAVQNFNLMNGFEQTTGIL